MISIARDVLLAPLTTFRIGGRARFFAEVRTETELLEALRFAAGEGLPIFALGGGSNLLVRDEGFSGLVLHLRLGGVTERQGDTLDVPAGTDWDFLVRTLCEQAISGMECLAGIPGLVGACPIQNIGAYGQEVAQTIVSVRAYDLQAKEFVVLAKEECRFAYRESIFNTTQRKRYLITSVCFLLDAQTGPNLTYPDLARHFANRAATPLEVYEAVRAIRRSKGMLLLPDGAEGVEDTRSAGSFFKNPIVGLGALGPIAAALGLREDEVPRYAMPDGQIKLPSAWLLEKAGFHRSYTLGRAGISSRHTLALINRGDASYADVGRLRDQIREVIRSRFQLTLEQEPVELESGLVLL